MENLSEIELVQRCKDGDMVAFRQLYDSLAPGLMSICRRYYRDNCTCKDMFQDGFAKIVNGIGKFEYRGAGSLRAWASKIMLNNILMHKRSGRYSSKVDVAFENDIEVADPGVEEVRNIPAEVLLGMIDELPERCKMVLNLFAFEGLSHEEIAARMGIDRRTSSTQLIRARRLLAEKIKQYCQNEDNQ